MIDTINRQKNDYDNFIRWLRNFDTHDYNNRKLYTISGNAGTGKTTLVQLLKYRAVERIEWVILDFSRASEFVQWPGGGNSKVMHFDFAFGKVFAIILDAIYTRLFCLCDGGNVPPDTKIIKNIRTIVKNYRKNFNEPSKSRCDFLVEIGNIVDKYPEDTEDISGCIVAIGDYCAKYYSKLSELIAKDTDITGILEILLFILRCMNNGCFKKKFVIVFDNIERFINQDEIFNDEVDSIRLHLNSFLDKIYGFFSSHRGYFKFLMAVRTSTARMIKVTRHAADAEPNDLNIDQWYDTDAIIERRLKWYKEVYEDKLKETEVEDEKMVSSDLTELFDECKVVSQIIGDCRKSKDGTITGLKPQIDALFNHNKRLILEYIGMVVESNRNRHAVKEYLRLWNEDERDSKDSGNSRYAARSIIWGLILSNLEGNNTFEDNIDDEHDQLFMHLHTYSKDSSKAGLGDARKILTVLYNLPIRERDEGVSLISVLSKLYGCQRTLDVVREKWDSKDPDYAKRSLIYSEVLYYMNSYNRRDNNWIQFIDIQMPKKNKQKISIKNSEELRVEISEHMNRIKLHIMPAGGMAENFV